MSQVEEEHDLDPEVKDLVKSLNLFPGLKTICSCCGHGRDVFNIWFRVKDLTNLLEVLWCLDGCHSGVLGWHVEVNTDCGKSNVTFRLGSTTKGEEAYEEARRLARFIKGV